MTPDERSVLQAIGQNFIYNTWHTAVTTLFYGIYLVIFCISTASFLSRGMKLRTSRILFASNFVSFLVATVQWGDFVGDYVSQIRSSLLEGASVPFDAGRLQLIELQMFPAVIISNWSSHILPFIADIVVVWRSWVLFRENKWLILGPIVLLIGATAASVTYLGLTSSLAGYIADDSGKNNSIESVYTAFLGLSLATNVSYTLLVFYKLWRVVLYNCQRSLYNDLKRSHRRLAQKSGSQTPAERALLVLVESGALFCMFQVAMLGLVLVPKTVSPSFNVALGTVLCTYTLCCAIYPPVVVILVNSKTVPVVTFVPSPNTCTMVATENTAVSMEEGLESIHVHKT